MTAEQIADVVQRHVAEMPALRQWGVEVIENAIRHEDDWWFIPIHFGSAPGQRYSSYDDLNALEDRLKEKDGLDVLLVPAAD